MDKLDELESQSIYIIREAYYHYKKLAVLWSIGKDSTALMWLVRKAFFGKVPIPALHIDTTYKFKEIYEFREKYCKMWDLDLVVARNDEALAAGMNCEKKLECCTALKTDGLKLAIAEHGFEALLLGIRRDEHGIRAKERYFSPRDYVLNWKYQYQPPELWDKYKNQTE
jgi:sulfate adenylyltransferase subunit 2